MNRKRVLSMVLAMLLLAGLILPAGAAEVPKVTLSGSEMSEDGTIALTASIEGNPGMAICQLYFYFDTDVFEVKSLRPVDAFSENGGMMTNSIAVADERGRYDGKPGKDGMLALWYSSNGTNVEENGRMAVLRLQLKEDVQPGSYEIGLDYSRGNTFNQNQQAITLRTQGVTYTIPGAESDTPAGGTAGESTQKPTQKPSFSEMEEEKPVFDDVAGNWAEEYILEANARGIVLGDKGHYYPNDNMSRAEFMMILWRVMGSPAPKGKASFGDLPMEWYQAPIAWAEENGVTNGTTPTTFGPEENVTREQMMTILHRVAGKPMGMEMLFASAYEQQFTDSASLSAYAKNAVHWAVYNEILCGEQTVELGQVLAPRAAATRSQIAVSIIRYLDR